MAWWPTWPWRPPAPASPCPASWTPTSTATPGVDFLRTDLDGYRHVRGALAATGVVALQPTFVTSAPEAYAPASRVAAEAAAAGRDGLPLVLGLHLEGPFLSPEWPGAHDPEHLRPPDPALMDELLAPGGVTTVTLAPELDGALELVEMLAARGVLVSCGHSDADAAQAHAAFDRGARAITHVHNAHRRWRPRDPGLGGVALARPDVHVQAIVDGVHLAPETEYGAFLAAGTRFVMVTDAVEAAADEGGRHMLGDRPIAVRDGAVRLPDGTLAGSVATLDASVRRLVAQGAGAGRRRARGVDRARADAGPARPRRAPPGRPGPRRGPGRRPARSPARWSPAPRPSLPRRRDLGQPGRAVGVGAAPQRHRQRQLLGAHGGGDRGQRLAGRARAAAGRRRRGR